MLIDSDPNPGVSKKPVRLTKSVKTGYEIYPRNAPSNDPNKDEREANRT